MASGDFQALPTRMASDKVLPDKASNIAENLTYDGYQKGLASRTYKYSDKKLKGTATRADQPADKTATFTDKSLMVMLLKVELGWTVI